MATVTWDQSTPETPKRVLSKEEIEMAVNSPELTEMQKKQLADLLQKYADRFSAHDFDLGDCNVVQHRIDTQDHPPISLKPYRLPFALREVLAKHIDNLLKAGLIRPSASPWAAPCLLVEKPDKSHQLVCDYRSINKI